MPIATSRDPSKPSAACFIKHPRPLLQRLQLIDPDDEDALGWVLDSMLLHARPSACRRRRILMLLGGHPEGQVLPPSHHVVHLHLHLPRPLGTLSHTLDHPTPPPLPLTCPAHAHCREPIARSGTVVLHILPTRSHIHPSSLPPRPRRHEGNEGQCMRRPMHDA